MTAFAGWILPTSPVTGDTWTRGTTGITFTFNGEIWVPSTPADGFAGILATGGATDTHFAKASAQNFHGKWVDATLGILAVHTQGDPSAAWDVGHSLRQKYVHVLVVNAIGDTWYGPPDTVLVPRIVYTNILRCMLHFTRPVQGTAYVRR